MKFAVIQFPGSNCDQDCTAALNGLDRRRSRSIVWHKESSLEGFDAIVLPGGFSYGDYLRCGAIARFSPIMRAVVEGGAPRASSSSGSATVFKFSVKPGCFPERLVRNRSLRFVCDMVTTRVEVGPFAFHARDAEGTLLRLPVAHGEGCFFADERTLQRTERTTAGLVALYRCDGESDSRRANPNGSVENIAGICNRERNVFGLMPHPDRACEERLGSSDGARIFDR